MSGIFGSLGSANPNPRTDAPTGQVSVRIYRPQGAKGTLPNELTDRGSMLTDLRSRVSLMSRDLRDLLKATSIPPSVGKAQ
jgi:hypothetical protein